MKPTTLILLLSCLTLLVGCSFHVGPTGLSANLGNSDMQVAVDRVTIQGAELSENGASALGSGMNLIERLLLGVKAVSGK